VQEDKRKAITKVMQDKLTQEVLEEILEYKEDGELCRISGLVYVSN